jgi:SOS response regulatory protein OraA/RecX
MSPKQKIYEYAIWLLSKRSYSSSGLKEKIQHKLKQKQMLWELSDTEVAELCHQTLEALTSKGLLDDQRHKGIILRRYQSKWGYQKVKMKLRQDEIELSKSEWDEFQNTQDDPDKFLNQQLEKAIEKYSKKLNNDLAGQRMLKQKVIQHLMQKGHSYDDIKRSLEHFKSEKSERQNYDTDSFC